MDNRRKMLLRFQKLQKQLERVQTPADVKPVFAVFILVLVTISVLTLKFIIPMNITAILFALTLIGGFIALKYTLNVNVGRIYMRTIDFWEEYQTLMLDDMKAQKVKINENGEIVVGRVVNILDPGIAFSIGARLCELTIADNKSIFKLPWKFDLNIEGMNDITPDTKIETIIDTLFAWSNSMALIIHLTYGVN